MGARFGEELRVSSGSERRVAAGGLRINGDGHF